MPALPPLKACFSLSWPVDALGYCSMIRAGAGPALEDYCIHCLPFSPLWNSIQQPRLCSLLCKMLLKKGG